MKFKITIFQSKIIECDNWEDAQFEAKIWSLDENSQSFSVEMVLDEFA